MKLAVGVHRSQYLMETARSWSLPKRFLQLKLRSKRFLEQYEMFVRQLEVILIEVGDLKSDEHGR
jgi:hypothetical protein